MFKKLCVMAIVGTMVMNGGVQSMALEKDMGMDTNNQNTIAMPCMEYIASSRTTLNIDSNGTAKVNCSVYGYSGTTTKVKITAKLQQYKNGSWITVKTFTASADSHYKIMSESCDVVSGYKYRVQATVSAYSGSLVETRTETSSEIYY